MNMFLPNVSSPNVNIIDNNPEATLIMNVEVKALRKLFDNAILNSFEE
jgi:hypothetical protein